MRKQSSVTWGKERPQAMLSPTPCLAWPGQSSPPPHGMEVQGKENNMLGARIPFPDTSLMLHYMSARTHMAHAGSHSYTVIPRQWSAQPHTHICGYTQKHACLHTYTQTHTHIHSTHTDSLRHTKHSHLPSQTVHTCHFR